MVTPTPTRIQNGIIGLKYILEGEAHYGDGNRNEYLSYINCLETKSNNGIYKQFQACWKLASAQNETQLRHFIISFSNRELSADNESDIILAHEWATEFFAEAFPGRQILVATQRDNKNRILHVHAMVNNCRIGDGKGFTESERSRGYFRIKATEFFKQKFAENNINYDYGRKHDRSYGLFEREFFDAESTEKLEKHLKAFQAYKAAKEAGADDSNLLDFFLIYFVDNRLDGTVRHLHVFFCAHLFTSCQSCSGNQARPSQFQPV